MTVHQMFNFPNPALDTHFLADMVSPPLTPPPADPHFIAYPLEPLFAAAAAEAASQPLPSDDADDCDPLNADAMDDAAFGDEFDDAVLLAEELLHEEEVLNALSECLCPGADLRNGVDTQNIIQCAVVLRDVFGIRSRIKCFVIVVTLLARFAARDLTGYEMDIVWIEVCDGLRSTSTLLPDGSMVVAGAPTPPPPEDPATNPAISSDFLLRTLVEELDRGITIARDALLEEVEDKVAVGKL